MEYDILYCGQSVTLINCTVVPEGVYYGCGHYSANTSSVVSMRDPHNNLVITIKVPDEAVNQSVMMVYGDADGPNFAERASIQL